MHKLHFFFFGMGAGYWTQGISHAYPPLVSGFHGVALSFICFFCLLFVLIIIMLAVPLLYIDLS